ncbi:hypothetical protein GUJ93_ZPchr0013g37462 [Zizania palustris]|uniref:Uncharacterized protein n=1 Tax=Zizania palustris TaxID=103762 RepID=A0A8J5X183_ZIZPA|nr:hypothetical protein GUJ93_ZPchr0013g37462 [Zizania palustris]
MGEGLRELPADGVSGLCFSRHSDRLLVSSWDKMYTCGVKMRYEDTISWVAMMPQLAVPTTPTPLGPR